METKFSEFNKDFYKKVKRFIKDFSYNETQNNSYSYMSTLSYWEDDQVYLLIDELEEKIESKFNITFEQFFNQYKDKIYDDDGFTSCCGFLDILLYRYDKEYLLGGDLTADANIKYLYGFQNSNLGKLYIKQKFETLDNFYKSVAEDFVQYFDFYYEIVNRIEDCCLIFAHSNDFNESEPYPDHMIENMMEINDIIIIFIGDSTDIDNLVNDIEENDIEEYVDFNEIRDRIMMHKNAKKYNI